MLALCAAIGSFQVKSPTTYLVSVLTIVFVMLTVLFFFLIATLALTSIRFTALFVSIFGVR